MNAPRVLAADASSSRLSKSVGRLSALDARVKNKVGIVTFAGGFFVRENQETVFHEFNGEIVIVTNAPRNVLRQIESDDVRTRSVAQPFVCGLLRVRAVDRLRTCTKDDATESTAVTGVFAHAGEGSSTVVIDRTTASVTVREENRVDDLDSGLLHALDERTSSEDTLFEGRTTEIELTRKVVIRMGEVIAVRVGAGAFALANVSFMKTMFRSESV